VFLIEKLKDEWKIVFTIGKIQPLENIKKKILNLNKKTLFSIFLFFSFEKLECISNIEQPFDV
jgi:hypothetical protein